MTGEAGSVSRRWDRAQSMPARRGVLACMVLLFASGLEAAVVRADNVVHLPYSAEAGDTFEVRVSKFGYQATGEGETRDPPVTAVYDGEVVVATAAGFRITWDLRSLDMPGLSEEEDAELLGLAAMVQAVPVEFEADLAGTPVRIPFLQDFVSRTMETLAKLGSFPPEVLEQTEASLKQLDSQSAAFVLLPDALTLSSVQNRSFRLDAEQVSESLAPSPFGGTVKLVTRHRLEGADNTTGFAAVSWTTEFDADSLRESVMAMFAQFIPSDAPEPEAAAMMQAMLATAEIERRDTGLALISMDDGWVRKMHVEQTISSTIQGMSSTKYESVFIEVDRK